MLILNFTLLWCIIVVTIFTLQNTGVIMNIVNNNKVSVFVFPTDWNFRTIWLILFFDALTCILHHWNAIFPRFNWTSSVTASSEQLFFPIAYNVCTIQIITYSWFTNLQTSSLSFIVTLLPSNTIGNSKVRAVKKLYVISVWQFSSDSNH